MANVADAERVARLCHQLHQADRTNGAATALIEAGLLIALPCASSKSVSKPYWLLYRWNNARVSRKRCMSAPWVALCNCLS
jgi:hypothetical protein